MGKAWHRPLAAAATAVALATLLPGAATAVEPSLPPTSAELQQQADREAAELQRHELAQAIADADARAALEGYQVATRRAEEATRRAAAEAAALAAAERATAAAKQQMARYLGSMYRSGLGDSRLSALTSIAEASSPQRLFGGLGLAQRIGENQDDAVLGLATAEATQNAAADRARRADDAAEAATGRAAAAKQAADAAVAKAAAKVAAAAAALATTQQAVGLAEAREARLALAESIARERSGIPAAAIDGAFTPRPLAECKGGTTTGFPNGQIPTPALCPLWGTSGQMLRADAAAAFDAMSHAYAEVFSAPICVTDSYRDYPAQVAVAAAKPTLAAVPGTSNHGWGVAVDLCDGIQSFGSEQHAWMKANSMAYGWFHPAWAQAGGSKPEAWHWEFAG